MSDTDTVEPVTATAPVQHHSHPETWPTVVAAPFEACDCTPEHDETTPATAFPVAVVNPLDAVQRTALLDTLIAINAADALDMYNAIIDTLTEAPHA